MSQPEHEKRRLEREKTRTSDFVRRRSRHPPEAPWRGRKAPRRGTCPRCVALTKGASADARGRAVTEPELKATPTSIRKQTEVSSRDRAGGPRNETNCCFSKHRARDSHAEPKKRRQGRATRSPSGQSAKRRRGDWGRGPMAPLLEYSATGSGVLVSHCERSSSCVHLQLVHSSDVGHGQ